MSGSGSVPQFSESAPRPPVFPGEENAQNVFRLKTMESQFASSRGPSQAHGRRSLPHNLPLAPHSPKGSSPLPTPRRGHPHLACHDDVEGIRRYEAAEGSASTSPPLADTPPYLRWAENLRYLLNDSEGIDLFKKYLIQEDAVDLLTFWFACEGMKRKPSEEDRSRIIRVIHRKYIRSRKIPISEPVRKDLADRVAAKLDLSVQIFDAAQKEVEYLMQETAYPNFLRSDVYLSYLQAMQSQNEAPDSPRSGHGQVKPAESGSSSSLEAERVNPFGPLATVPEDVELMPSSSSALAAAATAAAPSEGLTTLPLTTSALLATQTRRATMHFESRPPQEFSSGMYLHGSNSRVPHPYHATSYVPFNPVSRQDSELQSLSSDAQTDDTRSLTDSSVDGMSIAFGGRLDKSRMRRWNRKLKENAAMNRDPAAHQTFIPRTQRLPKEQQGMPQNPEEFASALIYKLELVKRDRENEEKFNRKLLEKGDFSEGEGPVQIPAHSRLPAVRPGSECSARVLAEALQKLGVSSENDTQSILDAHVQRIWSDQTPLRSPGVPSPRPWSPELKRKGGQGVMTKPLLPQPQQLQQHQQQQFPPGGIYPMAPPPGGVAYGGRPVNAHFRRKEKDSASVFSADSGAVIDHMDGCSSELRGIPKSRSMPEGRRMASSLAYAPKKDLADSGLSLVSDTPAGPLFAAPTSANSKEKVMSWIMDSDKYHDDREGTSKHSQRGASTTSPVSSRRSRKQAGQLSGSRSESVERSGATNSILPVVQGESVSALLGEDPLRGRPPTRPKPSLPCQTNNVAAQQSTLKKHRSSLAAPSSSGDGAPAPAPTDFVVVTFTFGEEAVPYRSKIPGKVITLKQFKDILPKKGNYRYYFKTTCEDDVTLAVHQEVMDDTEILPLWEGKVFGLVKHVD